MGYVIETESLKIWRDDAGILKRANLNGTIVELDDCDVMEELFNRAEGMFRENNGMTAQLDKLDDEIETSRVRIEAQSRTIETQDEMANERIERFAKIDKLRMKAEGELVKSMKEVEGLQSQVDELNNDIQIGTYDLARSEGAKSAFRDALKMVTKYHDDD